MDTTAPTMRIDQLPLWRLLVALSDAERVAGADSPTARVLAREIRSRLTHPTPAAAEKAKGGKP